MRSINYLVVHCTATRKSAKVKDIVSYWQKVLNWKNNGYHYIIDENGVISNITPVEKIANGASGHNADSIHIAYIGGININGTPSDTRNEAQKLSLNVVLKHLKAIYPKAQILGHRDFNGVKKECPCFNAKDEYKNI